MFLTSNLPVDSIGTNFIKVTPQYGHTLFFLFFLGGVAGCSDFFGYMLNIPNEQMLTKMVFGKGVPKCPDDTEDWCACVSKAVLAKCIG